MENLVNYCNHLHTLTNAAITDLEKAIKTKFAKKGSYILQSGKICNHLFFIRQGITKTFFHTEEKEFIMRFFTENALFTVLDSFNKQQPSTYSVVALEDTTYDVIDYKSLKDLCDKHHCIEAFFSKLLAEAAANMMQRITEMLEENPAERYARFVKNNPALLQRITLGDLASYLGITQVSLSRIRARK